jgi:TRAP transporter TAXI family solute receptor
MKMHICAAIAALSLGASAAAAQTELSIATGGTGGVYFPYGGGMAEVINRHIDGYTATAEVTGASVENMNLIASFESDMALVLSDTLFAAYNGTGPFEGAAIPEARTMIAIYPNAVQLVTLADSGITSLADLRGQRVSVGAPGSGTEVSAQTILAANGITYDDFDPQRLNFNETADALRDGTIVAGFWSVGPPTSSIMNLAATRAIRMIPLSEEEIANAIAADPTFAPYTLREGLYEGMAEAVPTISTPNMVVVHAEMDEELVYQITKAMFEHVEELIAIHPAANDTVPEFTIAASPIPVHPGALRYFEEIGLEIPDALRP